MTAPVLPAPRTPGRYSIALVCLGNICRSPMADVVLSERVDEAGLSGLVRVVSSGTGGWHVGKPMDPRSAATLTAAGYDATRHRAQQFAPSWLDEHDLVLVMDSANLADVGGAGDRVMLLRELDPVGTGGEVPDPYYGGDDGFEEVLEMVERTSAAITAALQRLLGRP
ncbi:low molecular weight protein-tyrosine-phosphatase [Nocardioides abyssi]|uniref:protein-tyrosine-phosphatase n=1 Tax=Nocardioides abyssi TaxID=3058370 RepID=A0ABT8ESB3_9ACTN|nr:low molecular weight protein-tyrosine-phosphatase [Nocardioides abyssi]MDN4160923.1 low molecular weight protein-tyrosine-phosphatase [Nocardioides abyssi]